MHRVLDVRPLTDDAFILDVERHGLLFEAGQHVTLGLHGAAINREYSIYSAPGDAQLSFLIRIRTGSDSSRHLRNCRPGDALDLAGPYGAFGIPAAEAAVHRYLLVATGAGIAPFHSLVAARPGLDYRLVHGIRTRADAYEHEMYGDRYLPCVSNEPAAPAFQGRVTDWVAAHPAATGCRCLLCGHAGMVADVYDLLRRQGVPSDNLLTEVFF